MDSRRCTVSVERRSIVAGRGRSPDRYPRRRVGTFFYRATVGYDAYVVVGLTSHFRGPTEVEGDAST